jgi:hypothetical protein
VTVMEPIPIELDIEGLYEDHDRGKRKSGNERDLSPRVQVCDRCKTHSQLKLMSQQASTSSESSLTAGVSRQENEARKRAREETSRTSRTAW